MDGRDSLRLNSSQPLGMMVESNSYGAAAPNGPMVVPNSAGMMHGMRLSFDTMTSSVTKPMDSPISLYHGDGMSGTRPSGVLNMGEPMKKKKGRPRKYGADGSMALALIPRPSVSGYHNSPMSDLGTKRRGRPPGSGKKKQLDALGSSGIAFTPHVITVKAGEDVASKIMAFSQQGPRTVCILSANGAICNVTLRQPATSGGTVTYEGRFEIISLSGSFLLTEDGGTRSRTGGLSVALAGSDGRVLGGSVAGMLMAATPVQVVMGSFIAEGKSPKPEPLKREPLSAPPQMADFGIALAASPPSEGTSSESSDDPGSLINQSGTCNNSSQHIQSAYASIDWSHSANPNRHDSDMKMIPD
ncbi:AT-hook motif nuclear-localized protein 10-like isoform X2 [Phoenix dactylifera]|uniref:AT-hook motif nuclear-localized protein n=1 Tax=Phoenix dactylifera TaxID=42345 RepID=A0A8B8ZLJ9_PHODC|nr:AT-hook motif nuclear-localized protein 10-like isoform X2 [Phoenix dactylifera]